MCKKIKAQTGSGGDSGYVAGIDEQELAIDACYAAAGIFFAASV